MLIPYSCDAPVYHWPIATVGLIVTNVAAFVGTLQLLGGDDALAMSALPLLVLVHGDGFHPIQWVTSMFMHAGPLHLIGNMLFLWIFGLVVEGKIGWWRFLLVYLAAGIAQSAVEQAIMLGVQEPDFSLGASSAIYAIMAIALIWAPKNGIDCFYWFGFIAMGTAVVPIFAFVAIYLALDLVGIALAYSVTGNAMSSGLLHLMGALVGAPIGLVLLKNQQVDCEGWDALSLWRGGGSPPELDYRAIDAKVSQRKQEKEKQQLAAARQQIDMYLQQNNLAAAVALFSKMKSMGSNIQLDRRQLVTIVRGLHAKREWAASAPFMAELIGQFPESSDPVRIKLAHICVAELDRPARALELLSEVDFKRQPPENVSLAKKIAHRAKSQQAAGVVELDDAAW